jgi:hypothetical protein
MTPEVLYVYISRCVCDQISKETQSVQIVLIKQKENRQAKKKKTFRDLLILIICSLVA